MNFSFKRLMAMILTVIMIVGVLPSAVFAAEDDINIASSENVAKVGDTEYDTLANAIEAAQADDTVTLINDVNGADVTIAKAITLDLGDKTINEAYIKIAANVTVQNGSIKNVTESYPLVVNSGALTIENVEIEASKSDRTIWLRNSGTVLNFNSGSILATKGENNSNSKIYGVWVCAGATANINGGTIEVDAGADATAVAIFGNYVNTVNISGGKISTSGKNYSYAVWTEGDVTVTGGEIVTNEKRYGYSSGITYGNNYAIYTKGDVEISGGQITTNGFSGYLVNAAGSNQEITVSNVEFTNVLTDADKTTGGHKAPVLVKGDSAEVKITGGEFNGVNSASVANNVVTGATVTLDGQEMIKGEGGLEAAPSPVATVNGVEYTDIQEAIIAAAPNGTVELLSDVTVDTWKMFASDMTHEKIITCDINGLTINGNGYTLTIGETVSGENGTRMFYDATNLTVKDLTISITSGSGIGLKSGTIEDVTFIGGTYAVLPGNGNVTITGCTFKTSGTAIYYENAVDNLIVTGNTFDQQNGAYAIQIRGNTTFTGNTVDNGNVTVASSATGTISGNDFNDQRFKVYNTATATITNNEINNLVFNDATPVQSAFTSNTLSTEAQAALDAVTPVYVAEINGTKYTSLQAAINAAQTAGGEVTITLTGDITENVTINEADGLYLTIDGADKTMNGTITVNALSNTNDNRRITIDNVNFVDTNEAESVTFIYSVETNHYPRITVTNCDFTGSGYEDGVDEDVAIRLKSAYDAEIKICTGKGLHSFLQNNSGVEFYIYKVTVTDSKGGLAMGTAQDVTIRNCDISANNYGIRLDAVLNTSVTLNGNTVNAYIPVSVRKATATEYKLTVSNDSSSYTATNTDGVWMAICSTEYEEGVALNEATGNVKITWNTDVLAKSGVYGAYEWPIDVVFGDGYTKGFDSLVSAMSYGYSGSTEKTIIVHEDITEKITSLNGNITTDNPEGVTITNTYNEDSWVYCDTDNFTIGENVTFNSPTAGLFVYGTDCHIYGTVNTDAYYQRYAGSKLTIHEPGSLNVSTETFIVRYMDGDSNAGIYIVGDNNDSTIGLNASVIYFYQGMINAKDADIKVGTYWQTQETDNQGSANLVLDNSNMTVTVNEHKMKATGNSTVTLTNGSNISVAGGFEGVQPSVDKTSSIKKGDTVLYPEAPKGSNSPAYTREVDGKVRVWGEGGGNALDSFVLELYSGETLIATTTLNNVGGIIDGDVYVTWHFFYPSSNDEYWTTTWEEGHPNSLAQPTEVKLIIDGTVVATTPVKMSGADDINPVVWKELGGVEYIVEALSGTGTQADPFLINNIEELKYFRDQVNAGNSYAGKYVKLTDDINLNNEEWTPIGTSATPFNGVFDGDNHTISNLVINGGDKSDQGFFGRTNNGEIKNVTFNNAKVSGRLNVAVVAGTPYTSKYTNIKVTGHVEVNGMAYVGGVGGKNAYANWTDITVDVDSASYVKAYSTENGTDYRTYVGGVIGFNGEGGHTFKNISSDIKVIGNICDIGGIFGIAHYSNNFENITFTGSVEAPAGAEEVGGIAGVWHNQAGYTVTFDDVTSTGNVTVGGVTTTGSIVGGAYNAGNETPDNSGSLIIDGKEAWVKVAEVNGVKYTDIREAFKAATDGCTIEILADVVVDYKWDCRDYATNGSHSQFKESVTINGNGHTITFTGEIKDNNWNTVFRFEENATVTNLTIDISAATGVQRVISAKKSLTVNGLKIVGAAKYGIIFGEGASAAELAATEIVIKNSDLNGTRRAISDNEGGKDVKSVTITGNNLKANAYISASESIEFNNNTAAGEVDLRSYAADNVLEVEAQGNTLTAGVKNYIYAKEINAQVEFDTENPPIKVSTKAELNAAIAAAKDGDTIIMTADIDYGTDQLQLHGDKAFTLDLGGFTLTTRNAYGGMSIKNNATVKNGTIVHASNTAAIKVWNATAFEDLVIDVQGKGDANKVIGGIVLQSGTTTRVDSIKNVTIKGDALTNGIETYNCGDATQDVIGSMENVIIDANGTGMLISAPCGTATNCDIKGGTNGIEIWIKGNYSASLDLVDSDVTGGVYAHDEFNNNPGVVNNGTLSLTADAATTGAEDITVTVARAENVDGIVKDVIDNAQAKVNDTYYATLADAMAAAVNGDKVTLLKDIAIDSEIYTIADGVAITLDMNGKKITVTDNKAANVCYELFYIYGEMTVTGNGTIELTSTSNDTVWAKSSSIFHNRGGVLTIENGKFAHLGGTCMAFVVDNSGNYYGDATTNINGGELTSTYTAIRNRMEQNSHGASGKAILNISGGKIDGTTSAIWAQAASQNVNAPATGAITVTGGEIGLINTARSAGAESMTTITGGTVAAFKGEAGELKVVAPGTITGTVTIMDASGNEVAYAVNADGLYIKAVATIGNTGYATLEEAIAAVQEGETVTILAGTLSEGTIKLPATLKNVTIKGEDGAILKDMTISAADGNSYSYIGLTFDGITFDNSRLLFTGWRNGEETIEDLTITNCVFKNLNDDTNTAPVHINKDASEAVNGFTFTNNVIDGATGGQKSAVYLQATGKVVFENNVINNVAFRPYVIQLTSNDGVADELLVNNNTFSGTASGRAQALANNAEGTDAVKLEVTGNIFKDITTQQICYWNFNPATTTVDLSKNYYDIDIEANPNKIYFNGACTNNNDLKAAGMTSYYKELNADGTIKTESLTTVEAQVASVTNASGTTYYKSIAEAMNAAQAGDTVTILAGDYTTNLNVNKAITVVGETDAEGNNLVNFTGKLSITADGATVKNLNFNNGSGSAGYISAKDVLVEGCTVVGGNGFRYCYTSGAVTFKDSTITGSTYGIHFDGSAGGEIVIDNCVITGWTSFASTIKKVTMTDTTFNEGNYNFVRLYQEEVVIDGCTFNENMEVDLAVNNATVTVTDTTLVNGTAEDLFSGADIVNSTITVDGEKLVRVAKIGDTYYKTLQDAIAAAVNGDTIVLVDDLNDIGDAFVGGKTVTIDGNGHTVSGASRLGASYYSTTGDITFKNINFKDITPGKKWSAIMINHLSGTATIDNCTFTNVEWDDIQIASNKTGAKAVITNCTFDGKGARGIHIQPATDENAVMDITITGNKFYYDEEADATSIGIWFPNATSTLNIEKNYVENPATISITLLVDGVNTNFSEKALPLYNEALTEEIKHVAKVQSDVYTTKFYTTITDAIKAAADGDVVEIFAGTFDEVIKVTRLSGDITIKGADNFGTTLTGGILIGDDGNIFDTGKVTVEGINFTGNGVNLFSLAGAKVIGNKFSDITGIAAIYVQADNYTDNVEIKNNEINNVAGTGIRVRSAINVTIDGNTVAGTKDNSITLESAKEANNGTVVITNNVLSDWANNEKNEGRAIRINTGTGTAAKTITVENNVMTADTNATEEYAKITGAAAATISVDKNYWGGNVPTHGDVINLAANPANYYADSALTTLVDITYEAQIGNLKYTTLADAFAKAEDGDTITLIDNIALSEIISNTKTIVLDLNGKTITGTDNTTKNFSLIDNRGDLTITGNGTMTLTATVDSGWNRYSAVIANNPGGKLTVENGTIEHLGGTAMAYAIDNLTNGKGTYAETVINGGTIKSTYRAIRQFLNGVEAQNILTINGGTVAGNDTGVFFHDPSKNANSGTLTIKEGAMVTGAYLFVTADSTEWPVEVSIAKSSIYGDVTSKNIPLGYELRLVNGNYTVVEVNYVAKIGDNYFETLDAAVAAANDGDVITLIWAEGDDPIAMNAKVFGKTVTITGTATVDWSKGNLFVGRGGAGNGTVIFDGANLTSASNSTSYGIHVSGREKDAADKYDGTLVIKNSVIELDYLINKGVITLDNSTLTVKNGFSIGGRPASETESGEDATAIIDLTNGSKVVVNNHNGMGLGYEAIGVMNIDATSTFETTQSFLVTAKGTMNIAGTATIAGTLTNEGAIVLTAKTATLTSSEYGNVTTTVADHEVKYADGKYSVVEKVVSGTIKATAATLLYEELIQMRFKFTLTGDAVSNGILVFNNKTDADNHDIAKADQNRPLVNTSGVYYGYTDGIPAKNMGDTVYVVGYIELSDGTYVFSQTVEYSPLIYARSMVVSGKPETQALCKALMQYGAAAQTFMNYNTGNLMNEGFDAVPFDASVLGEEKFAYQSGNINGFTLKAATMVFEGAISYRFRYQVDSSIANKPLYMEYTVKGETKIVELEYANGSYYGYAADNAIKDMDELIVAKPFYYNDNNEKVYGGSITYSGYEYARSLTNSPSATAAGKALAQAFAMLIDAANTAIK